MAAPVLTIGGVNQTPNILDQQFSYSLNTLDVTLYDPATLPALGDAVTSTNPTWAGTVSEITVKDNNKTSSHKWVKVTATNTDEAVANPAANDLRDVDGDFRNLEVTTTLKDGVTEVRGSLETFISGFNPGDVFELTAATHGYTAEEFSIQDISVGWLKSTGTTTPLFKITFGDPIVTLSAWVEEESGIFPIEETQITDGAVTTPKLAANSVDATKIVAGTITADKLAAILLLGSLIQTAEEGNRVEMDADGFRVYSADEDLLVNMPTDESPIFINAEVVASSLTTTGAAVLQSNLNSLAQASVLTLDAAQQKPTQAPTLAQGWPPITMPYNATYDHAAGTVRRYGLSYDASGGAGGSTKVFWTISSKGGVHYLLELLASDRTVNRTVTLPTVYSPGYNQVSCVRHSSWVYVLYQDPSYEWTVKRYTASSLALSATYTGLDMPNLAGNKSPVIGSDGTNLFIADKATSSNYRWNKYDATMVKVGSTIDTGFETGADDHLRAIYVGNADIGAARIFLVSDEDDTAYSFNTSGTHQTNEDFPVTGGTVGLTYGDALADGARFWALPATYSLIKHTTWTWTTASPIYWVAYSWYDQAGTTHETEVGPMASITMGRRRQLTITGAAIPFGGADDPDRRRVYMVPSATAPATTALKLHSTTSAASVTLTNYNSGGAAPPTSNGFSSVATPATIRSAAGEWVLSGDGTIALPEGSTAGMTITNAGTATFSNKVSEYTKIDRMVIFRLSFTVTATGSGASTVGITGTGLPQAVAGPFVVTGARSGVNAASLNARMGNSGGELQVSQMHINWATGVVQGPSLINGDTWIFHGAYLTA